MYKRDHSYPNPLPLVLQAVKTEMTAETGSYRWMGDRLGTLGAVGILILLPFLARKKKYCNSFREQVLNYLRIQANKIFGLSNNVKCLLY